MPFKDNQRKNWDTESPAIRKNSKILNSAGSLLSRPHRFSWRRAFRFNSSLQLPLPPPSPVCISCGAAIDDVARLSPTGCGQSSRSTADDSSSNRFNNHNRPTKNVPSTICEVSETSDPPNSPLPPPNLGRPPSPAPACPTRYPASRPTNHRRLGTTRRPPSGRRSSTSTTRNRVIYDHTVRTLLRDGLLPTADEPDDEREILSQLHLAFKSQVEYCVDQRRLGFCRHSFRPSEQSSLGTFPALAAHRHPKLPKIVITQSPEGSSPGPPFALSLELPPRRSGVDFESHGYEYISSLTSGKAGVTYLVRSLPSLETRRHLGSSCRSSDAGSLCAESFVPVDVVPDLASYSRRLLTQSVEPVDDENGPRLWVAKVVDLSRFSSSEATQARLEAEYLRRLRHPFIVRYRDSFVTDDRLLVIVMEYCAGGDLFSCLSNFRKNQKFLPEERILQWTSQIALAIQYAHSKKILHCDLKTSNIFITTDGNVKVGDFGIAREIKEGADCLSPVRIPRGTPIYMSPEMCRRSGLTDRSDCWALGCILYEMCHLRYAFPIENLPAPLGSLSSYSAYITTAELISNIEIKLNNFDNSSRAAGCPPTELSPVIEGLPESAAECPNGRHRSTFLRHLTRDLLQPSPADRPSLLNLLERLYLAEFNESSSSVSSKASGASVPNWIDDDDGNANDSSPPSATSLPI